jgi:hypothetical protein
MAAARTPSPINARSRTSGSEGAPAQEKAASYGRQWLNAMSAPRAASARQIAVPIPCMRVAPVTRATSPANSAPELP